jgi:hypothetical protein
MEMPGQKTPVRDNDLAPIIYGDVAVSVSVAMTATITVAHLRSDLVTGLSKEAVVSGRLVLSVPAMVDLHKQLSQILETMKQSGQLQLTQRGTMTLQ